MHERAQNGNARNRRNKRSDEASDLEALAGPCLPTGKLVGNLNVVGQTEHIGVINKILLDDEIKEF